MKYKVVINPKTKDPVRFLVEKPTRGGFKFIAKRDIPANVLEMLLKQGEVDDKDMQLEGTTEECIFCQASTRLYRLINGQTIALCRDHYYSESLGKVVQQVRVLEEAK